MLSGRNTDPVITGMRHKDGTHRRMCITAVIAACTYVYVYVTIYVFIYLYVYVYYTAKALAKM